jgi:hypothetical protein
MEDTAEKLKTVGDFYTGLSYPYMPKKEPKKLRRHSLKVLYISVSVL